MKWWVIVRIKSSRFSSTHSSYSSKSMRLRARRSFMSNPLSTGHLKLRWFWKSKVRVTSSPQTICKLKACLTQVSRLSMIGSAWGPLMSDTVMSLRACSLPLATVLNHGAVHSTTKARCRTQWIDRRMPSFIAMWSCSSGQPMSQAVHFTQASSAASEIRYLFRMMVHLLVAMSS